jgi:hypothetical protein
MTTRWYQKLKPGRMAVAAIGIVAVVAASTLSFTNDDRP